MARTQELIATYQNTVLTAGREVQTPLRGFLRSREQAEDLDRSVKAATAATQLGVQQYRTGTIDFNRVFNLETTQVQQQDQLAVAAGNIALNLVNVYRALGGGWELRLHEAHGQPAPPPAEPSLPAPLVHEPNSPWAVPRDVAAEPSLPAPLVREDTPASDERKPG